jgi:3-oxoacyl-[acyl-carrier protein] reductase
MTQSKSAPVALVTGAAGGIGQAICLGLAEAGFRVAAGYHSSAAAAEKVVGGLPGGDHAAVSAPVTDTPALTALATRIEGRFGRCDVLVNCAATTRAVPHGDLNALDDALFDLILTTNVRGPYAAIRAFRRLLERSDMPGGGVVVNISSIAATLAMGSNVAYCASKAALDNLTRSLARALAPAIRVASVSPGLIDTGFVKGINPAAFETQAKMTPLKRLALTRDISDAVLAIITRMTYTTGIVIAVDGGRLLM